MKSYSLSHLSDQTLLHELRTLVAQDRKTTAALLAHIAEVDARKLYRPAGYPSMYAYCVGELRLSEEAARKRIHAARVARQAPSVYGALVDGRLHLSAVVLLAPYLTPENATDLLAAAAHKTKFEIEQLIAERFPRLDVPALMQIVQAPPTASSTTDERAPGRVEETPGPRPKVTPVAPRRFALQLTVNESTHDKLRYAQELLSHQIAPGDLAELLDRVLDLAIPRLEKRKFAATAKPRPGRRLPPARGSRSIPAGVKRAVWERDGGQCTFTSESGKRCPSRTLLEFDHIDEVARGGRATVDRMRLRCRAHNQYAAECTFGAGFMNEKRERSRRAAAEGQTTADVIPWLRQLGFKPDEARRAAAACEGMSDASLEQRVRVALAFLAPPHRRAVPMRPVA